MKWEKIPDKEGVKLCAKFALAKDICVFWKEVFEKCFGIKGSMQIDGVASPESDKFRFM